MGNVSFATYVSRVDYIKSGNLIKKTKKKNILDGWFSDQELCLCGESTYTA